MSRRNLLVKTSNIYKLEKKIRQIHRKQTNFRPHYPSMNRQLKWRLKIMAIESIEVGNDSILASNHAPNKVLNLLHLSF